LKNLENDEERISCSKSIMLRKIRQIRLLLRSPLLSPYFLDYNKNELELELDELELELDELELELDELEGSSLLGWRIETLTLIL